jgi:hypothetical protein
MLTVAVFSLVLWMTLGRPARSSSQKKRQSSIEDA